MCEDCENSLVLDGFRFHIDEQLTERLAKILIDNNPDDLKSLVEDIEDRLEGRCFCSAYSKDECLCGAWR